MKWTELFPKETPPDMAEIGRALKNPLWEALTNHIAEAYAVSPQISYSVCGAAPGWNVKYKKGGRSLCVLYPGQPQLTCLVCIGQKEQMEAELLLTDCTEYTQTLYETSGGLNGTCWMMIAVSDEAVLTDVKRLISTRIQKKV